VPTGLQFHRARAHLTFVALQFFIAWHGALLEGLGCFFVEAGLECGLSAEITRDCVVVLIEHFGALARLTALLLAHAFPQRLKARQRRGAVHGLGWILGRFFGRRIGLLATLARTLDFFAYFVLVRFGKHLRAQRRGYENGKQKNGQFHTSLSQGKSRGFIIVGQPQL
jgi:hypothetical protein